ncbi:MAG: PKD domain-containing protein, partial [Candidatus Bipolaricaulia bacterium]
MALRQTARWSENRRGSGFRACIALLLLTGLVAGFIAVTATAQTYPRCITGCTAKDVTLENVYLDYTGSGAPGEPIDADIIATLNFNRVNSYCVRIVADVYINNVLVALNKVSQPYGFDAKGLFDLLLGPVSWPYGSVLELRNIQIFWSVDVKLSDPDSCVGCIDYGPGSKCVGYASFEITQPLVADFEGDPLTGCAALVVQFTDLSAGGYSIDPYTYDWDFGDGTAHSTNANPLHTYENPGAYTVILTVSDSRSETDSETKTSYVVVADCSTDLRVTKIANSNPVAVGDLLTYTITAWNDGPGEASGVVVEDLIPAGTDFSSASATRGSYSAMSGTWNIGTLAVGASETLTLGVVVTSDAGPTISNTACIDGTETDPDPLNDCSTMTTNVTHAPVLQVLKTGPGSADVGDTVTYSFDVSHAPGSDGSDVSSITVSDTVAGAASYVSGDDGDTLLEASETWRFE